MEIVLNADVIFASPNADFRLPEVLRGVSALAGALPRCSKQIPVLALSETEIIYKSQTTTGFSHLFESHRHTIWE